MGRGAEEKYTAAQMVEALEQASGVVSHAADILQCARSTIYDYAGRYVTVERAMKENRKRLVVEARDRMADMMRSPTHNDHFKATVKILSVYDDELDWADRQKNEITGASGGPVTFQVVNRPPEPDE